MRITKNPSPSSPLRQKSRECVFLLSPAREGGKKKLKLRFIHPLNWFSAQNGLIMQWTWLVYILSLLTIQAMCVSLANFFSLIMNNSHCICHTKYCKWSGAYECYYWPVFVCVRMWVGVCVLMCWRGEKKEAPFTFQCHLSDGALEGLPCIVCINGQVLNRLW